MKIYVVYANNNRQWEEHEIFPVAFYDNPTAAQDHLDAHKKAIEAGFIPISLDQFIAEGGQPEDYEWHISHEQSNWDYCDSIITLFVKDYELKTQYNSTDEPQC